MHTESDHSESFDELDSKSKILVKQLIECLQPIGEPKDYAEIDNLYGSQWPEDTFYLVTDGCLCFQQNEKDLFHFNEGDLVGLVNRFGSISGRYYTDQYVQLQGFSFSELKQKMSSSEQVLDLWNQWQASNIGKLVVLYSLHQEQEEKAALGFEHYQAGDVIIREGEPATEVYAIIEGHAEVRINDIRVGEVLEEEIFGAMALLTNSPRSATVIATQPCSVIVVPRDQFNTLMQTHPHICYHLLESFARKVTSLNQQIITLKNPDNPIS